MSAVAVAPNALALIEYMQPGDRLYREGVSWDAYEALSHELDGVRNIRLSYDQGRLEIMSISPEHEKPTGMFTHLIQVLTEELALEFISFGSSTLKRQRKQRGKEPDDCFYIGDLARIIDKQRLDLDYDEPPDLAIEVDITNPSINKFSIYAGLGVPELWRYDGEEVEFFRLEEDDYAPLHTSDLFPFLTTEAVAEALRQGSTLGINAMRRAFRQWVQDNKPPAA
jgi:Uma2 family endonuclease